MQFYAFDSKNEIVLASSALRGQDYICPECRKAVYKRGGAHRQDHFYHLELSPSCRQSSKSQEHLNVQMYFQMLLPKGQCSLEHRFSEIGRIADVFWSDKKIVFEVQCSQMDLQELIARNRDYGKLGISVVWILHDKKYNKESLFAIESYLHHKSHYFTNIDENGVGYIYDQFSLLHKGKRLHRFDPLPIEVSDIKCTSKKFPRFWRKPHFAIERLKQRSFYFSGDIVDSYLNHLQPLYLADAAALEKKFNGEGPLKNRVKHYFFTCVVNPYKILLQLFLERCCR